MTAAPVENDFALRAGCARWLSSHGPAPVPQVLAVLGAEPAAQLAPDYYGVGGAVAVLEARTGAMLGKPAASFVIKGMIAQTALLRTVTEAKSGAVVVPRLGHMAVDEADAIRHLLHAEVIELGDDRGFTAADLAGLDRPIAVCVVELPVRRAAYQLMPLDELRRIADWCRQHGVHLHIDGARLWEAAASYGVSLAEISALADTVYVSFYKGLGALAGAGLGGDLHTAYPFALSALEGLDRRLSKMPGYLARARQLAAAFAASGFEVTPAVPHVNAFQLTLPGDPATLFIGNPMIAETASSHWSYLRCVMGAVLMSGGTPASIWQQHEAIMQAVSEGDVERAGQLASTHISYASGAVQRKIADDEASNPQQPGQQVKRA